jgi:acetyl esterase/lipase
MTTVDPHSAAAGATEALALWPDSDGNGPPTVIDGVPPEAFYPGPPGVAVGTTMVRNVSEPTLTVYPPAGGAAPNGVGVIVIPGGGWTINAWTHEGVDVARWLAGRGCTAFLLKYRVMASDADQATFDEGMAAVDASVHGVTFPSASKPRAIGDLIKIQAYLDARAAAAEDGRRAIGLVREHADRYGVRPETIGMIGFSAGAFLTVDVAMDPQAPQVAWIAPIYGGETGGAPVPADAPPLFAAVAGDDILVKIVEGLYGDWSAADRPAELHNFRRGGHGFGMVKQGLPSDAWISLFEAWLADLDLGFPG